MALSRMLFISPTRSADSTASERTEPSTSRTLALRIDSRRCEATCIPPAPTARRNCCTSEMRQRAKASTISRRSSSGVTSSEAVSIGWMRPS